MYLRDASERIRILHVRLGLLYYLATLKQLSHTGSCDNLALMRTNLMNSVDEGRGKSVVGIQRHGSNLVCPVAQTM